MLTPKERARLDRVFAGRSSKELALAETASIADDTKISLRAVEWFALDRGIVPRRYQRHMGCLGIAGQKRLLESCAVVLGLGGLGGYVVEELARIGVGKIVGVDPDVFDETNLNRQLLSTSMNLGQEKTAEAGMRLRKVNQATEYTGYAVGLETLADEVYRNADLAFDCLDNFESRLFLAKKCDLANLPLVHGAIAGWYGQVGVVWPGSGMLEKIYRRNGRGIETGLGNPPFTAALAASLMATAGVKVLTGKSGEKGQKILMFDLLDDEWQTVSLTGEIDS